MEPFIGLEQIEEAAEAVRQQLTAPVDVGLILGSGLSPVADAVDADASIPYGEIPHFPKPTVGGHKGRLVVGRLEGQSVAIMQGRFHYYEGYSLSQVTLPVRVMQLLGIDTLIVTNAAGGLRPEFEPGDVMLISDHINLVGMAGSSPLRGPNLESLGPRFPDMSDVYDEDLRGMARTVATEEEIPIYDGVYIWLVGPNYETPADIRFLCIVGADGVGMSTVPEVIVARHGGMRVLGLSGISNVVVGGKGPDDKTTHEEVLETGRILAPRIETIIRGVLKQL